MSAHIARERVLPRPARNVTDVPAEPRNVTSAWLTAALCSHVPGARVEHGTTLEHSAGSSTRWTIDLEYNDAGTEAGLPATVFAKTTAAFKQRLMLGFIGIIAGEPTFFRDYRGRLDIEAPIGYFGAYDAQSWRSISLIENVAVTKGATFVTPQRSISRSEIEQLLADMASWHGTFWQSPQLQANPLLRSPAAYVRRSGLVFGLERTALAGVQQAGDVVPPELAGRTDQATAALHAGLAEAGDGPFTLLHGDPHIGNTYVTAAGRMGFTDWQIIQRGSWVYDFAYLVNGALTIADRRAWERELLAFYLDRLAAAGGQAPDPETAWRMYRGQAAWPYFAWLLTLGHGALQPNMQPDAISIEMVARTAAAVVDHETLSLSH